MDYNKSEKIPHSGKKRIAKQREAHIIWALDKIDTCIKLTEKDTLDKNEIKEHLKKIRKEICKL